MAAGLKSEAQGNPWISDLVVIRGVWLGLSCSIVGSFPRGLHQEGQGTFVTEKREKNYNSA